MADRPYSSPWGKVDSCRKILPGVYEVSTSSHGGIMVSVEVVDNLFSTEAINCGFRECGYMCFEEDCDAAVVIRELLDKHMWKIPKWYPDSAEAYSEIINQSLIRWHPEYWESRGNTLPHEAYVNRLITRVQANFNESCDKAVEMGVDGIRKNGAELSALEAAYKHIAQTHTFNESEVKYLLLFQNPLIVVADNILSMADEYDFSALLQDIINRDDVKNCGKYALINNNK